MPRFQRKQATNMENCLNYVWIGNDRYYNPRFYASGAPIPAEYINKTLEFADQNPLVQTFVWYDHNRMPEDGEAFLQDIEGKPTNLIFRPLQDIQTYLDAALFKSPKGRSRQGGDMGADALLWKQVDLARLLVLDHVLNEERVVKAFYSDFDLVCPYILSRRAQSIIARHGFLLSYLKERDPYAPLLENNFMGFHRSKKAFVRSELVPVVVAAYGDNENVDGWEPFCESVAHLCFEQETSIEETSLPFEDIWGNGKKNVFDRSLLVKGQKRPEPKERSAFGLSFLRRLLPNRQKVLG